jgi:hypothetical protein
MSDCEFGDDPQPMPGQRPRPLSAHVAWELFPDVFTVVDFFEPIPANRSVSWGAHLLARRHRLLALARKALGIEDKIDFAAIHELDDDPEACEQLAAGEADVAFSSQRAFRERALQQRPEDYKIAAAIDAAICKVCGEVVTGELKAFGYDPTTKGHTLICAAEFFRPPSLRRLLENRVGRYEDVMIARADGLLSQPERAEAPVAGLQPEVTPPADFRPPALAQDPGESPRARAKRHEREARDYLAAQAHAAAGSNELLRGADSMWRKMPGGRGGKISRRKFRKLHKAAQAEYGVQARESGRPPL